MKLMKLYEQLQDQFGVESIADIIKSYIKSSDNTELQELDELTASNTDIQNIHKHEYNIPVLLYRGIGGKGECPSNESIIQMEKESNYNSVTKSYDIAEKYTKPKSNDWKVIIEYNVPPTSVVLDVDLFNKHTDQNIKNEEEVIINIHTVTSMEITHL